MLLHSKSLYFFPFSFECVWPEWNELTKSHLLGHLTNFVFKFRMQVWGSDSLDVFTQHHMCCDIANRYTFSHFHLNTYWELTKWPLLGYLIKFVIKFRMQVWDNDSMDLFTQHHVCCDTADCYTSPIFIWILLGPNEMIWPNDLSYVIWVN